MMAFLQCHFLRHTFNSGVELDLEAPTQTLTEKSALELSIHIGLWDECLKDSYDELDPSVIVKYLFKLCKYTNKCFKELTVKGMDPETARYAMTQNQKFGD